MHLKGQTTSNTSLYLYPFTAAIQDGLVKIVTFVPDSQAAKTDIVLNPWNASVRTVGKVISATNLFAVKVVMKPLDFVTNPANVGADWAGLGPIAKPVFPILDVKTESALNPGNVDVMKAGLECCAILRLELLRPPPPSTFMPPPTQLYHPLMEAHSL